MLSFDEITNAEVYRPTVTPYYFLYYLKLLFTEADIAEVLGSITSDSDQFDNRIGSL